MNSIFTKRLDISSLAEDIPPVSIDESIINDVRNPRDLSLLGRVGIKKIGQVFTPPPIVKNILDLVGYKSDLNIENKSILDPSCGMGAFVGEAVSRLRKHLIMKYDYNPRKADDARQIIERVCHTVHGIELSETTARNAVLSYLFSLKEEVMTILKVDRGYRPPASIYTFDTLDQSVMPKDHFDFIVGNPPYVQSRNLRPSLRELYEKHFATAKTRYNLYGLFYERSLSWLRGQGVLGFISSNSFFYTDYGRLLRELLISKTRIRTIIDFRDANFFEGVETYPAILILEKKERHGNDWRFPYSYATNAERAKSSRRGGRKEPYIVKRLRFPVRQDRLSSEPWTFLPDKVLDLFAKIIKEHIPLR